MMQGLRSNGAAPTNQPLYYNTTTKGIVVGTNVLSVALVPGTNVVIVPTNFGTGWGVIIHGNNLVAVSNAIASKQNGSMTLSNLIAMGITNIVAGTNVVIYTNNGTLVVNGTGSGTGSAGNTNGSIYLSAAAGKPALTNMSYFDGSYDSWELQYPRTNTVGTGIELAAAWTFTVPNDYATNTAQLQIFHTITATNGPNSSNVIWRASFTHYETGSTNELRTGPYGTAYQVTNVWAADYLGTNRVVVSSINFSNVSGLSANGLGRVKIERMSTDTYVGAASIVGVQINYGK